MSDTEDFKQRIKWDWNNKARKSYQENDLEIDDKQEHQDFQVKHFFSKVDHKKKYVPVRSVTKIVRCKAVDVDSKVQEQKEYLYYYENWYGKDWLGRDIPPVTDHLQGRYQEQVVADKIDDFGDVIGRERKDPRLRYYIPFSKKAVDDIISTSDNTDKNNIKFCFKGSQFRNDDFTYEQFVNSPYELMEEMLRTNGGPRMFEHWQKHDTRQRQENFKKYQQVT